MRTITLCLLVMAVSLTTGQELIQNGGFEDSLSHWTVEYNSPMGTWEVSTGPDHQPDPDNECYVVKAYKYNACARQTVDVTSTELLFAGSTMLSAMTGGTAGYYAYATLALEYQNASGGVLGKTMFIYKTSECSLVTSSTQHIVAVDSGVWHDLEILVDEEMDLLTGINRGEVAKVAVVLEGYGTGATG